MGNILTETREGIMDLVEELFIMGFTKGTRVSELLKKKGYELDIKTVRKYLDIARRRLHNKYKEINRNKVLRREIRDLDYMEQQQWINFRGADNANEKSGAMNTILKIKERRAKLLGLDTENLNLGGAKTLEDLIKENEKDDQQRDNRRIVLDTGQKAK